MQLYILNFCECLIIFKSIFYSKCKFNVQEEIDELHIVFMETGKTLFFILNIVI